MGSIDSEEGLDMAEEVKERRSADKVPRYAEDRTLL
jgi:hypothetical protein